MAMTRRWPYGYYTYTLCSLDGTPYYVGAGKGNRGNPALKYFPGRCSEEERLSLKAKSLSIIVEHDSKEDAFAMERELIARYGRRDLETGILLNQTDGKGSTGRVWTDSMRDAVREAQTGRAMSPEHRKIISEVNRGNKHRLGKRLSPETRAKISASLRNRRDM